MDHYSVLQVSKDASPDDIQRAYRALALRYHPDRNSAPDAAVRMAALNEAYEILRDRMRRREYDAVRVPANSDTDLHSAILQAARDIVLRSGWSVLEEAADCMLLVQAKQRVRVFFVDRLDQDSLRRLLHRHSSGVPTAILAVRIEGVLHSTPSTVIVGLMRGERLGAALGGDEGSLFKPLLSAFM